ncbi:MAG: hypothetical protein PHI77_01555 [Candidatus Pacebacteria bacterium]|nr:hypothetical protein [Candidatus Paceibacterota bacterium]MDD4875070.1 hypothetical protein [Candidatus Paceibacterota bacterium]
MFLKDWAELKIRKMDWLDMAMVKWSCVLFGILLAIIFPELLSINAWWMAALFAVLLVRPLYRIYLK